MKKIFYSLYAVALALVLAGGVILFTPPTTVYACTGSAKCLYGDDVSVPGGATSCSCVDNVGCTWIKNGVSYSQPCAKKTEDELNN
jgi:hypothetical protein